MGLFGRDDRNPTESSKLQIQTKTPTPQARHSTSASATVIAQSSRVEGSILGSGDVRIEGEVKGRIETSDQLLIDREGMVHAKISARSVIVAGGVVGDISATERIELDATAKVEGDIAAPRILIKEGATFDGQIAMKAPGRDAAAGTQPEKITTTSARRSEEPKKTDEDK
jgi:cytoskeletal protein CcmA (bactofilin family)